MSRIAIYMPLSWRVSTATHPRHTMRVLLRLNCAEISGIQEPSRVGDTGEAPISGFVPGTKACSPGKHSNRGPDGPPHRWNTGALPDALARLIPKPRNTQGRGSDTTPDLEWFLVRCAERRVRSLRFDTARCALPRRGVPHNFHASRRLTRNKDRAEPHP